MYHIFLFTRHVDAKDWGVSGERLILNLNHTAMDFLRKDNFRMATKLLQKAESNLMQVNA